MGVSLWEGLFCMDYSVSGGCLGVMVSQKSALSIFFSLRPLGASAVAMAAQGAIAAIGAGVRLPIAIGGRGDDACLHGIADFLRACGNEIQNGGILLLGCEI